MMKKAMIELQESLALKFPKMNFTNMIYDKQNDIDHTVHYYTFTMLNEKGQGKEFQLSCLYIPYNETIYQLKVRQVGGINKAKKTVKITKWDIKDGLIKQLKLHFNMK